MASKNDETTVTTRTVEQEHTAVAVANVSGRWQFRIALISSVVAIITSLLTIFATSSELRVASLKLDNSTKMADSIIAISKPLVPIGTVIASLLPPQQFSNLMGTLQGTPTETVWVLADGRDIRGSQYAKISGESAVPDLRDYSLVDTQARSGKLNHGESLVSTIGGGAAVTRSWQWLVSLREADPTTPFPQWEQRMQTINISADDPSSIVATATIKDGKHDRFAPASPASVNYLGISILSNKVYWYIKINDG